jgi:hypothetical protein
VGCLNHNIQHDTSQSAAALTVNPSKYQGLVAYLRPVATVAGAETHYICIKKTCYEYKGNGGSQS